MWKYLLNQYFGQSHAERQELIEVLHSQFGVRAEYDPSKHDIRITGADRSRWEKILEFLTDRYVQSCNHQLTHPSIRSHIISSNFFHPLSLSSPSLSPLPLPLPLPFSDNYSERRAWAAWRIASWIGHQVLR
jgi:hypothetical protein